MAFDRAGKTVWEWRLGEEMGRSSGYGGRTHTPLVDEDRVITSVVGTGLGRQGRAAPALRGLRQEDRARCSGSLPRNTIPVEDFNNQSNGTIAVIGGQRLMIGGGADGWIYALKVRTGELAWKYHFSTKSLNSPVTVAGDMVYATQSEEPVEGDFTGQVIAFDGSGTGDITETALRWHIDGLAAGFAAPALSRRAALRGLERRRLYAIDAKTGRGALPAQPRNGRPRRLSGVRRRQDLRDRGERQRPRPEPLADKFECSPTTTSPCPKDATWRSGAGSPRPTAVCTSWPKTASTAWATRRPRSRDPRREPRRRGRRPARLQDDKAPADAKAAVLQVVPAEASVQPGQESRVRGPGLRRQGPGGRGSRGLERRLVARRPGGRHRPRRATSRPTRRRATRAARSRPRSARCPATGRVRAFAALPWSFDFESRQGSHRMDRRGPSHRRRGCGRQDPPQGAGADRASTAPPSTSAPPPCRATRSSAT